MKMTVIDTRWAEREQLECKSEKESGGKAEKPKTKKLYLRNQEHLDSLFLCCIPDNSMSNDTTSY